MAEAKDFAAGVDALTVFNHLERLALSLPVTTHFLLSPLLVHIPLALDVTIVGVLTTLALFTIVEKS